MNHCLYHDRKTGWSSYADEELGTGSIQDALDDLREDGPVTILSDSMEIPGCRIIEGVCCGDEFTLIYVDNVLDVIMGEHAVDLVYARKDDLRHVVKVDRTLTDGETKDDPLIRLVLPTFGPLWTPPAPPPEK